MNADAPKKLAALLKQLKSEFEIEKVEQVDPIQQLIIGFLQWEASAELAEKAFSKLMASMVDINELRISYNDEVISIIGPKYPLAQERVARLHETLNEIFTREYGVDLGALAEVTKKQQRTYLDSLPGMIPYVSALLILRSFSGHAIPVDNKLVELLIEKQILESDSDIETAESFLQRHIKASDSEEAHLLLQAWSDKNNPAKAKKPKKKTTTKKSTKKTTTKKKTKSSK